LALGAGSPIVVPGVSLDEQIGQGGFGRVFRGRHRALDVPVAVKVIDSSQLNAGQRLQLLREAQLMARLDHPNLLRVFDADTVGTHVYLVLELMDGGSCTELRNVAPDTAVSLAFQLLSGAQALHEARILHRDIKPANCLLRARDHRVKLADLGLAVEQPSQSAGSYNTAGTLPFMAPELFENPPRFAPRSDIYALGMTLACMVLEEPPCPRGAINDVLPWILRGSRPRIASQRPDLSPALASLVERMISPMADARPLNAATALAELGQRDEPRLPAGTGAISEGTTVGPWVLGDPVYTSSNWRGFAVTHLRAGTAGRLMHLQEGGPLAKAGAVVVEAAERASRLNHRSILPVLDWGQWNSRVFVVTAAQGRTFDEWVRASGPVNAIAALRFTADLAAALSFIHAQGLVYQNLDPGAAVMAYDARSAQLSWPVYCTPKGTSAASRIFVPMYAAPEVLSYTVATVEPEVDIYGLGTVLHFLLTGAPAPRGLSSEKLIENLRALAPEVTAPVAMLAADLLRERAETRPSANEAERRLRDILSRLETPSTETPSTETMVPRPFPVQPV
jgi:serine/threonine protein kinase